MDLSTQPPRFPATRWSMVLAASGEGAAARECLEEICRLYWFPLYAFARQWGCSAEDAEDETQNFLAKAVCEELLSEAAQLRGRLRTFLLQAFQRDLIDARRRAHRLKRGGPGLLLSMDGLDAETLFRSTALQADATATYDRLWAVSCLDAAIRLVGVEYEERGQGKLFDTLRPFLDPGEEANHNAAATSTGMNANALRQAVFRLRQRFRAVLRATVAGTLQSPSEALIEEELSALRAALG